MKKQIPEEYVEYSNFVKKKKMFKHQSEVHRKKSGRSYTKRLSLGGRVIGVFFSFSFFLVYILIFFLTSERALLVGFFK